MATSTCLSRRNCVDRKPKKATRSSRWNAKSAHVVGEQASKKELRLRRGHAIELGELDPTWLISARRRLIEDCAEAVLVEAKPPAILLGKQGDFSFTRLVIARPDAR